MEEDHKLNILFLCVANCVRSQMAEGLGKKLLDGQANIESAGSDPAGFVHPMAIEVMKELGVDIANNKSKSVKDIDVTFMDDLDLAITLCEDEVCPPLNDTAMKIEWPIKDPVAFEGTDEEKLQDFRRARDEIKAKLEKVVSKL